MKVIFSGFFKLGALISALMPVRGILRFPAPQLNSFGAYIDIRNASGFFDATGRVTSLVMMVEDYHLVKQAKQKLQLLLGDSYLVKTWDEMQPDLVKMIEGDRAGAVIMKGILYLVVGFGIMGTIIMMISERKKEMGVMVALGMKKHRLQRILFMESLIIGMLGVVSGIILSFPMVLVLMNHPIPLPESMAKAYESFGIEPVIFFGMTPGIFINQAITVFGITLVIALYPMWNIRKMNVIKAIRGK